MTDREQLPPVDWSGKALPDLSDRPFAETLVMLAAHEGLTITGLIDRLGPRWRFLQRGLESVDAQSLSLQDFRTVRAVFNLPFGYFAEEREKHVAREIRGNARLRDEIFFNLTRTLAASSPRPTSGATVPEVDDPGDEAFVLPTAPPTFHELVIVGVELPDPEPVGSSEHGQAARVAIKGLIDELALSQGAGNFSLGFVTFTSQHVAAMRPAHPEQLRSPAFVDGIWASARTDHDLVPDASPLLGEALEVTYETVAAFLDQASDVPVAAVVLLLASGRCADEDHVRGLAHRLRSLPSTSVFAFSTVSDPAASDVLKAIATDESSPHGLEDNLTNWLHRGESLLYDAR